MAASTSSTVILQQQQQPEVEQPSTRNELIAETLTLRLVPRRKKKGVKWTEDTVEVNEFSGKRSSKKCCIFHKRRQFGDWSDDDDSDNECNNCDKNQQKQQDNGQEHASQTQPGPAAIPA